MKNFKEMVGGKNGWQFFDNNTSKWINYSSKISKIIQNQFEQNKFSFNLSITTNDKTIKYHIDLKKNLQTQSDTKEVSHIQFVDTDAPSSPKKASSWDVIREAVVPPPSSKKASPRDDIRDAFVPPQPSPIKSVVFPSSSPLPSSPKKQLVTPQPLSNTPWDFIRNAFVPSPPSPKKAVVPPPLPRAEIIWEYQTDDSTWSNYSPEVSKQFEIQIQMHEYNLNLSIGKFKYSIDLKKQEQTNILTGKTRRIRKKEGTKMATSYDSSSHQYSGVERHLLPDRPDRRADVSHGRSSSPQSRTSSLHDKTQLIRRRYGNEPPQSFRVGHREGDEDRMWIMVETEDYLKQHNRKTLLLEQSEINFSSLVKQVSPHPKFTLRVINKDWGVAAYELTIEFKQIFTVLNMANASRFGGGYKSGSAAQEENMFRRTTCSYYNDEVDSFGKYSQSYKELINGQRGTVYFGDEPRVCFRDEEDKDYAFLPKNKIFPFYELRAAAPDLNVSHNRGRVIDFDEVRGEKRIRAQFTTLIANGKKYVVLSAFGCGAFNNPPHKVAAIYKKIINEYKHHFHVILFSIIGKSEKDRANFDIFRQILM